MFSKLFINVSHLDVACNVATTVAVMVLAVPVFWSYFRIDIFLAFRYPLAVMKYK